LVIFGASGDLTKRKLIPGLYNLSCDGCMNPEFEVLGIGRTPMTSEEFRKKTGEAAAKSKDARDFSESGWTDFETRLHYMEGDINTDSKSCPNGFSRTILVHPWSRRFSPTAPKPSMSGPATEAGVDT
jgi:glucose-6-phosphate 1-dehydrogenase